MKTKSRQSGAALVLVLSVIILAVIMAVGLTVAMRLERSSAHYDLERTRAELLARIGIDYGQALLREATGTNRFWISAPGRISASDTNVFGAPQIGIALSSGYSTNASADVSVDLNPPSFRDGDRPLDPQGGEFRFRWIYVLKDGSYTNILTPEAVGRFAFWVDDESSRVNLNTAGVRNAAFPNSWPSQVSLDALPGLAPFASAIASSASNAPLATPYEALGRDPAWTNVLFSNRFLLTHYTQDPDIDPWGRARVVLSTRAINAPQNRPYLNILTSGTGGDPGSYTSLSPVNLQSVYANIVSSLTRNDWPYAAGNSFVTKYGVGGVCQMGIDVIEYVRAAESATIWPEAIFAQTTTNSLTLLPATTVLNDAALSTARVGTTRRPMISQVGIFCSTNTNASGYLGTLHVQLYLPANYNAGSTNFSGWTVWAETASSGGGTPIVSTQAVGPVSFIGGYANLAVTNIPIPAVLPSPVPTTSEVRVALLKSPTDSITQVLDIAPLAPGTRIGCPTGTNVTAYVTVNDPRLNKDVANWTASTNLAGDMPPPSHVPNFTAFAGVPPSDGSAASVYFSGTGSVVGSVAELGRVPSGVGSTAKAPWRSVRLQTNSSTATNIPPDWALLDLFSAPVPVRFLPDSQVTAGRINLNALIADGVNSIRTNGLNALFTNVTGLGVVSNVIDVRLPPAGNFGLAADMTNFVSVGQLCEVSGLGDQGEVGERVIREVASLATVRGSVFSVYSTGQAIQVVNNRAVVNGEKTFRAMIERYYDGSAVKYRIIHWSETPR